MRGWLGWDIDYTVDRDSSDRMVMDKSAYGLVPARTQFIAIQPPSINILFSVLY